MNGPVPGLLLSLLLLWAASPASGLTVDADFEGGSARVLEVDPGAQRIRIMPGGDAVRGWPCWWYFRASELSAGRPLTVALTASDATVAGKGAALARPLAAAWAMPERAFYSSDGRQWVPTPPGRRNGAEMIYEIPVTAPAMLVAWGPPYSPARAAEMVAGLAREHRAADDLELCKSREGRTVPMLRVCEGDRVEARRFGVWVQARQHAWEAGSSWVCEGFAEWLMGTSDDAIWLRQHAEVFIVPVMDVDNTATGNGGKDALPQDHNRDWTAKPNWNEVAAAQRILQELAREERMDIFLDLHNPAPGDKEAFFFVNPPEALAGEALTGRNRLMELAGAAISQAMPVRSESRIIGPGYHPLWKQVSVNWVAAQGNAHTVALCLETPWNTVHSTVEGYKRVGAGLAAALAACLQERPRRS